MTRRADLLVVGGGIAGMCAALAAADRGLHVHLVDAHRPGAASRASGGMLAPSVPGLPDEARALATAARDYYPAFVASLHERTGIDVPLDRRGIIELALSEQQLGDLAARMTPGASMLDAVALSQMEPALAGHAGGLLHPDDGAVDNLALMNALDAALGTHGSITRDTDSVAHFDLTSGTSTAHTATGTRIEADVMLLATGAWADGIQGLPRALPVRPLRGQLLRLDRCPVNHVIHGAGGYLVPRGATLLVGATSEDAGFDNAVSPEGLEALLTVARRAVPSLAQAHLLEHWAALRPVTPDALPILGPDPLAPALFYACGFSRNGILLAPWLMDRLAALIAGGTPPGELSMLAASRFDA